MQIDKENILNYIKIIIKKTKLKPYLTFLS